MWRQTFFFSHTFAFFAYRPHICSMNFFSSPTLSPLSPTNRFDSFILSGYVFSRFLLLAFPHKFHSQSQKRSYFALTGILEHFVETSQRSIVEHVRGWCVIVDGVEIVTLKCFNVDFRSESNRSWFCHWLEGHLPLDGLYIIYYESNRKFSSTMRLLLDLFSFLLPLHITTEYCDKKFLVTNKWFGKRFANISPKKRREIMDFDEKLNLYSPFSRNWFNGLGFVDYQYGTCISLFVSVEYIVKLIGFIEAT